MPLPRIGLPPNAAVLRTDAVPDTAPQAATIAPQALQPMAAGTVGAAATGQSFFRLKGATADIMLPSGSPDAFARYLSQLQASQIFNANTIAGLKASDVVATGTNAAPPSSTWSYSRTENATEPAVRQLQLALKMIGYDPGAIDGSFGDLTTNAVRQFQTDKGLTIDGVIGAETKKAMQDAGAPSWLFARPPVVAICLSDPHKLIPGRDWETPRLIAIVKAMGCEPVLVPPCSDVILPKDPDVRRNALSAMTANIQGVLGPGGADVDPDIYKKARRQETGATNFARDRFEADFAIAARTQPLFMFGICRSHQLWNAAFGGSLVQDVRAEGRSAVTQNQGEVGIPGNQPFIVRWPDGRIRFENRVHIADQSLLGAALLLENMLTNSYHHQAVDVPGDGMRVVGIVHDDELDVDSIEATEDWNIMSVQFHPEAMQDTPVQKQLLGILGQRAQVFWLLRSLQAEGGLVSTDALIERMNQLPAGTFSDADYAWVKDEVGPRLLVR